MSEIRCPDCKEPIWDFAFGSKLHKCWNTEGHEGGRTLAFDTPYEGEDDE